LTSRNEHLSNLAVYNEEDEAQATAPADTLLEDPIDTESSALPQRILGSEDPDEQVDTPDDGVDPNAGEVQESAELAQLRAESAGRLNEIANMRRREAESAEAIKSLKEMFLDMEAANAEREAAEAAREAYEADLAEYGPEVLNDPTVQYITEKVAQVDDTLVASQQQQEHYRQTLTEQQENARQWQEYRQQVQAHVATQEAEFVKTTPDYYKAYDYAVQAREQSYITRGYSPTDAKAAVAQETMYLVEEQVQRGGSVPEQVMAMAKQWGYTAEPETQPMQQVGDEDQVSNAVARQIDIGRIKQGLANQSIGQMETGASGKHEEAGGRWMTRDEFFTTVPAEQRMRIFMNDDNAFEQLGRTGRILVK
jgi:hypothetical protein